MSILLLLLLFLVCMQSGSWPKAPSWLDAEGSVLASMALLTVVLLAGSLLTGYWFARMKNEPAIARRHLRRFHSWQRGYFLALAASYLGALYLLGWGATIDENLKAMPGKEVVLFAPFLIALVCSWARFYDLEKLAYDLDQTARRIFEPEGSAPEPTPFLKRRSYVGLQARFNLLLIVPPLFLLLVQGTVLRLLPEHGENSVFLPIFTGVFLVAALWSIPWLLRFFLGLVPLPASPLRTRLEAAARRLSCRCSDILLWNTRNNMANAMVTGVLPWPRYVVLTDRLLRDFSPEEVEAVLGHEIGHVKHHHMFFYILFLLGSLFILGMVWEFVVQENSLLLGSWLGNYQMYVPVSLVIGGAIYVFVVFGCVSRFCESQADIYGCRTVSAEAFISALEKVAVINDIPRDKPGWLSNWRHPSIARRVDFLQRLEENPALETRFQRRIGMLKWALSLFVALAIGVILAMNVWSSKPSDEKTETGGQPQELKM